MIKEYYELGTKILFRFSLWRTTQNRIDRRWISLFITRRKEIKNIYGDMLGYTYIATLPGKSIKDPGCSYNVTHPHHIKLDEEVDY